MTDPHRTRTPPTDTTPKVVSERAAKQGRRGNRILLVLLGGLFLGALLIMYSVLSGPLWERSVPTAVTPPPAAPVTPPAVTGTVDRPLPGPSPATPSPPPAAVPPTPTELPPRPVQPAPPDPTPAR